MREVTVTYCDYCGKEITPPYSSVEYKDGRKLDLCSEYIENGRNCLQKHKDFEFRQNEEKMLRSTLIELGFKELPQSTITASLTYDLGRHRQLSFGSIQTPNEMLYIYELDDKDPRKITDLVCLRNFDYDGYTSVEQIKELITSLTGRVF